MHLCTRVCAHAGTEKLQSVMEEISGGNNACVYTSENCHQVILIPRGPTITHIFFPSKYHSDLNGPVTSPWSVFHMVQSKPVSSMAKVYKLFYTRTPPPPSWCVIYGPTTQPAVWDTYTLLAGDCRASPKLSPSFHRFIFLTHTLLTGLTVSEVDKSGRRVSKVQGIDMSCHVGIPLP